MDNHNSKEESGEDHHDNKKESGKKKLSSSRDLGWWEGRGECIDSEDNSDSDDSSLDPGFWEGSAALDDPLMYQTFGYMRRIHMQNN